MPLDVDVKAIRKRLGMKQARFSDTFGFSLDAIKHWERGRRTREAARTLLTVIDNNPVAVLTALNPTAFAAAVASSNPPQSTLGLIEGVRRLVALQNEKLILPVGKNHKVNHAFDQTNAKAASLIERVSVEFLAYDEAGGRPQCNAVRKPKVTEEADAVDKQLQRGTKLNPIQWIPEVLKDNFDTAKMPTTSASLAL